MHLPIGTEGKRAVASNEYILSLGLSMRFFIISTNWKEFLQTNLFFSMKGRSILFRRDERASWGAPMWEVMRRAG